MSFYRLSGYFTAMKMSFHYNSIVSLVYSCYYISIKECLKMLFAGCASQFVEMVFSDTIR